MDTTPIWIFGYGSLIWNPGFTCAARQVARLAGYRRSFSMRSVHYRGTEAAPGLVLALEAATGAACEGLAFAVPQAASEPVLAYLRERELTSSAYFEAELPLDLADGSRVLAKAFVIDPSHGHYCGGLALEEQAQIIAAATGERGPNSEYLFNTAEHLAALGLSDPALVWLAARVRDIRAEITQG